MKSMHVDWSKEFGGSTYEFVGRRVMEEKKGEWSEENHDGLSGDDEMPMMNYAYPIFNDSPTDKEIFKVCDNTNCTVVYNTDKDCYYLALTGGGMDLSQDIAYAYMLIDGCIDWDMLNEVYKSGPLSQGKSVYLKIMKELKRQYKTKIDNYTRDLQTVKDKIKQYSKK